MMKKMMMMNIAMIAKRFTKFLRMKTYGNQRNFRRERGEKGESNNRDIIICYKCKKPGHVNYDCLNLKKLS